MRWGGRGEPDLVLIVVRVGQVGDQLFPCPLLSERQSNRAQPADRVQSQRDVLVLQFITAQARQQAGWAGDRACISSIMGVGGAPYIKTAIGYTESSSTASVMGRSAIAAPSANHELDFAHFYCLHACVQHIEICPPVDRWPGSLLKVVCTV